MYSTAKTYSPKFKEKKHASFMYKRCKIYTQKLIINCTNYYKEKLQLENLK